MSKKSLFTRVLAVAGMVLAAAAAMPPAVAAGPATPNAAPAARILVVDMRRVIGMSRVGQSIQQQVEQLKRQAQQELNAEAESLKRDRQALDAQTAILAPAVKAQRIAAWQSRAQVFQRKVQQRGGLIQGGMLKANQVVEEALGPILQGIMQERQATVLLDRGTVLIAPNAIDVTQIVIQRLDLKMPVVHVELAQLPPGLQAQADAAAAQQQQQ
jgi:outer membrane protein